MVHELSVEDAGVRVQVDGETGVVQWMSREDADVAEMNGTILVKVDGREKLVKKSQVERVTPRVSAALENAVRADVKQGEMPIPMSVEVIRNSLRQGGYDDSKICCLRCGKRDGSKLCARKDDDLLHFECEDCLVLAAVEANVDPACVTSFVDARYLGSCEACFMMQRFGDHHGHQSRQ